MISTNLQGVAELVIRRAQRQGFVLQKEVREVLSQAGVPDNLWKDVLSLARSSIRLRSGRYYYEAPVSARLRQELNLQRDVQRAVRDLIREHKAAARAVERRGQDRVDFVQPVEVVTEDGRKYTLLSRDISQTGIRLIGTRRLLGQKVRVLIPRSGDEEPWAFVVRILWTAAVGEDLVENGGSFVEVCAPTATAVVEKSEF